MAQTKLGAMKVAAKKAGISLEEYQARVEAGLKRCTRCKTWKPRFEFNKDASRHDGLAASCWSCHHKRTAPGPSNRKRRQMRAIELEWCRGCKKWLPTEQVPKNRGACQPCLNRERREHYANNPEFRHRMKTFVYERKKSVEAVPPEGEDFLTMLFEGKCAYCGKEANTWDHIVPVSKGGKTTPGNILPACQHCNSSKKDRDIVEWMNENGIEPSDLLLERLSFAEISLCG